MILRYDITNEITLKSYSATKDSEKAELWKNKHIAKNTFGKPERDINYKIEYIDENDEVTVIEDSFDDTLLNRIISEREEYKDISGELIEGAQPGPKYKHYIRRVKADYVITETDVTQEEIDKEAKRQARKAKKNNAETKLAKILDNIKFDFNDPKDIKKAFRRILNYLEIDLEGDDE